MRRRLLLALLAAAAAARPVAGRTQPPERIRRVGVLMPFAEGDPATRAMTASLIAALARLGWAEPKNLRVDFRFTGDDPALVDSYAADLVASRPDALLAAIPPTVAALRRRTSTVPIVFEFIADPVAQGFVQSLARPGGNVTGFSSFDPPIMAKWLQLLKDLDPALTWVGVIFDPDTAPYAPLLNRQIEAAGRSLGVSVTLAPVRDDAGIEDAAAQARGPGGGLIALPDSFTTVHAAAIIAAAARHRLPLMGGAEFFPQEGALLSYFVDPLDVQVQAASYIDRILRGAKPADLPVQYPTKYLLVINLKTASALGLTVPQSLLAGADKVIE